METPTPEQRARLPKGMQRYIEYLEKRVERSTRLIAELRSGPADSTVLIRHHNEPDHLLGVNTPVTFKMLKPRLGTGQPPGEATITVHQQGPFTLGITADSGETLQINPQVSNTIKIRLGGWF